MNKDTKNFFEKLSGIRPAQNGKNHTREVEDTETEIATQEETSVVDDLLDDTEGQLTVDVYETPTSFVIKSAIAGVSSENLDISISADAVTIRGSRQEEERIKNDQYLHQECYWGKFARSVILPQEIDPDKAQASLKNGILKITLPKLNKSRSKKLKVKFE